MILLIETLIALAVIWFVWRFVSALFKPRTPADPVEDPFAGVGAPRKRDPKGRSGAVALDEPDEDEDLAFSPRTQ